MTVQTLTRREALVSEHLPYECCNCPFSSVAGGGKYLCGLVQEEGECIETGTPRCLGKRVAVKTGGSGEIAVVRIRNGVVYFRLLMDDGRLEELRSDDCTFAGASQ